MTEVTVTELRAAAELLFSHLERKGIRSVTLPEDDYWDVPADIRYDPYDKPTRHTIGQLSDDLTELRQMMDGSRPLVAWGFVWLAVLLRRVGETVRG
jgi:hypothetical protein